MLAALSRAWHSPRTGPVILILLGLPLLVLAIGMLAFPVLLLIGAMRFILGGAAPFAGFAPWYPTLIGIAWVVVIVLALQASRISRANRDLDIQVALRQRGRATSALAIAKRLHAAMAAPDLNLGEPIREDYGAGFWLFREADRFWLAVSEAEPGEVVLSLAYDPGLDLRARLSHRADRALFARLETSLRQAVASDPTLDADPPA